MKCGACGLNFNDGVQCSICHKQLDFGCAKVTEKGWRNLGQERRDAWKCPTCKSLPPKPACSPVPAASLEPSSFEEIMIEIRDIKSKLVGLPTLFEDIKSIKSELTDLKTSCEFMGTRLDNFATKIADVETKVSQIDSMQTVIAVLEKDVAMLKTQLSVADQRSRLNNVEIKGVPVRKDENLYSILEAISKEVDFGFPKSQVNYLYRVPVHGSNDKSIIVSFTNRYVKEEFVAAARARKSLSAPDIGFRDSVRRIFINDHLNAESKALLNNVKNFAKEKGFKYVWVKFGKIHIRRSDTSKVFTISEESDLNKLV